MATPAKAESRASDELYDRCNKVARVCKELFQKTFMQSDLLQLCEAAPLDYINSGVKLMPVVNELQENALFITLKQTGGPLCWSLRPRDAAKQVRLLAPEEQQVYTAIEQSHHEAIWIRSIKGKTGIKDTGDMEKILRKLSNLNLIKQVKSIKNPAQKTFMLYNLAPSDEVTGGSFYDAGDLDASLVEELSNLIVFHVRQMSWVDERKKRKREPRDIEDAAPPRKYHRSHKHADDPEITYETYHTQLAFPAGHDYPTAASIHSFIVSNNFMRAAKSESLTVDEVQNILNVLVWDEKLEPVNGGYRTVRGVKFRAPGEEEDSVGKEEKQRGNALTEAPCGRCPVIDLCGTGGPITAATCAYFDPWLGRQPAVKNAVVVKDENSEQSAQVAVH